MTSAASPPRVVCIRGAYIELNKLLKKENLAATGGEAKRLISSGMVLINGAVETRVRCKLRPGVLVECSGEQLVIAAAPDL